MSRYMLAASLCLPAYWVGFSIGTVLVNCKFF